jgi:S-adenosylmethionine hydrolase
MKLLPRFLTFLFLTFAFLFSSSCSFPFYHRAPASKEKTVSKKVIALLSDLGNKDFYVAALKGTIYSIYPDAVIVDITHQISPYNIKEGALTLYLAEREFPAGTIFVAAVDPGVGTSRRPIVVLSLDGKYFVGPDNGIFNFIYREVGVQRVYQIKNPTWMRQARVSKTFHGRDFFGPVAAHLAAGWPLEEVGPEMKDYMLLSLNPVVKKGNRIKSEVTAIDRYGNVRLNVSEKLFSSLGINPGEEVVVRLKNKTVKVKWVSTYGKVPVGASLLLISSTGFLELAVNRGSAARKYGLEIGARVTIEKPE